MAVLPAPDATLARGLGCVQHRLPDRGRQRVHPPNARKIAFITLHERLRVKRRAAEAGIGEADVDDE
jgi:hypothetical protein